jgi:hypothetical protein
LCLVCLHPVCPLSACGHIPARRVARACRYAATRILTDPRAPAPSLSCDPQGTLVVQQRAHRPFPGSVQRAHEPAVRREGRETHHRHTHTHTSTGASSLCMPLGAHTRASCDPRMPLCCHAHPHGPACPRALSLVCSAGTSFCTTTSSQPSPRRCSTGSRTCGKEGGERDTSQTHTHTSTGASSLCMLLRPACPRTLSLVCSAGTSLCPTTSSPPSPRRCSTGSRSFSKEGGERDTSQTHTHTHKHGRELSLHAAGGTYPHVVWHAHAAIPPRASSLTRVSPRPLSRVFRRQLYLHNNPALTCVALAQARIAALSSYDGPTVTCQVNCCASCVCAACVSARVPSRVPRA